MMKRYNPKEIEPKWQQTWADSKIYEAIDQSSKPKKYILEYFPYPSGAAMHVGHVRNYAIGDALARHARMNGYNVLHPMGWDAFGLPAENYAIKNGISPQQAIAENTAKFKRQLTQMGFSYDWSREVNSSDPGYYKWTQWFFLLLQKRGLAYQKESLQWWCPVDKTVLANEQVENGLCWRCASVVEKKALKQWFFKITDYADRLEHDLDDVNWSHALKTMQRNWIGRSKGAEVDFAVDGSDEKIKIFTTRPDTLYGASFMVLAPEHPLVEQLTTAEQKAAVHQYIKRTTAKSDIERQETNREKSGAFTGSYVVNPVNGEKLPIWITDYVLYGYGTGAVMGSAGHDERDYTFAKKYNLPIIPVLEPTFGQAQGDETHKESVYVVLRNPQTQKVVVLDWGPRRERFGGKMLIGGGVEEGEDYKAAAEREITEETGYKNFAFVKETDFKGHGYFYSNTKHKNMHVSGKGLLFDLIDEEKVDTNLDDGEKDKFTVTWQPTDRVADMLDDGIHEAMYRWLVLDEVYHGEGLMINSGPYNGMSSAETRDKIVEDLAKQGVATEKINHRIRDWLISRQRYWGAPIPMIHCQKCGTVPVPEDQLPVVLPDMKSYEPSGDGRSPLARAEDWVNTTCPNCSGPAQRETDTMDGFACSSWYFLRFADPHNNDRAFADEKAKYWMPVDDYIGGAEHAVMHLLYTRFWFKVMQDEGIINFSEPIKTLRNHGMILAPDGQKMSKSKGNTIEPGSLIDQGYGADAIRLMELFIGPWNQEANWSVEGMGGCFRFLQRIWTLTQEYLEAKSEDETNDSDQAIRRITHKTIKKVSEDLHDMGFNTAIAALMELTNQLYKLKAQHGFAAHDAWQFALESTLQLLAPFAPHMTDELWQQLGHAESIHTTTWPMWDDQYLAVDSVTIVVQINGKVRAQITMPTGSEKETTLQAAKADPKVATHLTNKPIKKEIYIPGRLVSFVI